MELKVSYFGMIAEATNAQKEIIIISENCNLNQLEEILIQKYKALDGLSYKIAIDQAFMPGDTLLQTENEIAVLPPFSGG